MYSFKNNCNFHGDQGLALYMCSFCPDYRTGDDRVTYIDGDTGKPQYGHSRPIRWGMAWDHYHMKKYWADLAKGKHQPAPDRRPELIL